MTLSTLSITLGLIVVAVQLYALLKPKEFMAGARKFPRSLGWGYLLMAAGVGGFLYFLQAESLSDYEKYKPTLMIIFAVVGVGVCYFVSDFLAVRGLALSALVLAKLMVDTGRPRLGDSAWVLLIQVWAYVLIVLGIWFTVSPWRCRDILNWLTATEERVRTYSLVRLAFGILVVVLGITVF